MKKNKSQKIKNSKDTVSSEKGETSKMSDSNKQGESKEEQKKAEDQKLEQDKSCSDLSFETEEKSEKEVDSTLSDLKRKDSFSSVLLWMTCATLVVIVSTWTAWFPRLFPESKSVVGIANSEDVASLASKINTLEAKIPDSFQEGTSSFLEQIGKIQNEHNRLSERFDVLEQRVSRLGASNQDNSREDGISTGFESQLDHLEKAREDLKKAQSLYTAMHQKMTRFLKVFVLYDILETALKSGHVYQETLQTLKGIVGPEFESKHFQILASYGDLGVPSRESLLKEIALLINVEGVYEDNGVVSKTRNMFDDILRQLKGLIRVRHKGNLDENGESVLERLKRAQTLFHRSDFQEAAILLKSIRKPSRKVQALYEHTQAYLESSQALLSIRQHLYSPLFLEENWEKMMQESEGDQ